MTESIVLEVRSFLSNDAIRKTNVKPDHCAFPAIGVPWDVLFLKDCKLAIQQKKLFSSSFSIIEADVSSKTTLNLRALRSSAVMVFVLRGQVNYLNEESEQLDTLREGNCFTSYIPLGKAKIQLRRGKTSALVIDLEKHLLRKSFEPAYTAFSSIIKLWKDRAVAPLSLPQINISKQISDILVKIRMTLTNHPNEVINAENLIPICLNIYEEGLQKGKGLSREVSLNRVKMLRAHLEEIYPYSEKCSKTSIRNSLGWSEWMLREILKTYFNTPINQHIKRLRIQRATILLQTTEMKINDISNEIGFSSPPEFIKDFKSLKGVTPSNYRKKRKYHPNSD